MWPKNLKFSSVISALAKQYQEGNMKHLKDARFKFDQF